MQVSEKKILNLPSKAVAYVRMSTEHQQYSTENQMDRIREYAGERGLEIIEVFADAGKSGLNIGGRQSLQRLIQEVESGKARFQAILVYDVSRWGRFQDADESAYYEYICRRAGIRLCYCAEQFENDGSTASNLIKSLKRTMAGEYSRELSVKVFKGQCRIVEMGFKAGGSAMYGLRRTLVDQNGYFKAHLALRERKSIQTDRVVLAPGLEEEVRTVQNIFHWFVEDRLSRAEIARKLNAAGIATHTGESWKASLVRGILLNENYIGNYVFNRRSFKLKIRRVENAPETWVRKCGAFENIVSRELFQRAQEIILKRPSRLTEEELLESLRVLYRERGYLSGIVINEAKGIPSSQTYIKRFGSLSRAYELIGYSIPRDLRFVEINRRLRRLHREILRETEEKIAALGANVVRNPDSDLLLLNGEITLSVVMSRCRVTTSGNLQWLVRFDASLRPDITIVVRLDPDNQRARDYYLIPGLEICSPRIRLAEHNGLEFESFRFDSLDYLYGMAERVRLRRSAG